MQVNLKKAAALAAALSSVQVPFHTAAAIDVYADPPDENTVTALRERLGQQLVSALSLIECVFIIRHLIGQANAGRVNELLTDRAKIERQLSIVNSLPSREAGTNLTALLRQLEAFKAAEKPAYGGQRIPNLELETATLINPVLRQLRRSKRDIDDELQALNFNTTIELPENVVKVLTDLDLV